MLSILLLVCVSVIAECATGVLGASATCSMAANSGLAPISGTIKITQSSAQSNVTIQVQLTGFNSSYPNGTLHGFHVHQNGLLTNQCSDAGPHFNPFNVSHGAPTDATRHVGDLGNVAIDSTGNVQTTITDNVVSLFGPQSVVGKAFVVHETFDDLGLGNFSDSKTTGHAGRRFGCCLITMDNGSTTFSSPSLSALLLLLGIVSFINRST